MIACTAKGSKLDGGQYIRGGAVIGTLLVFAGQWVHDILLNTIDEFTEDIASVLSIHEPDLFDPLNAFDEKNNLEEKRLL